MDGVCGGCGKLQDRLDQAEAALRFMAEETGYELASVCVTCGDELTWAGAACGCTKPKDNPGEVTDE